MADLSGENFETSVSETMYQLTGLSVGRSVGWLVGWLVGYFSSFARSRLLKIYYYTLDAKFEVFTAIIIQVQVFCVVTPCSVVVGYQSFGGHRHIHLQGEVCDGSKWIWM